MTQTMRDLQILLYKAKENGNGALGEDEIFPVALILKSRTDNELFSTAHFGIGYSGVRSPEIRNTLERFRRNVIRFVQYEPIADIYFEITREGEEETKPILEEMRIKNMNWENIIEEVLKDLEKNRTKVIREAKKLLIEKVEK